MANPELNQALVEQTIIKFTTHLNRAEGIVIGESFNPTSFLDDVSEVVELGITNDPYIQALLPELGKAFAPEIKDVALPALLTLDEAGDITGTIKSVKALKLIKAGDYDPQTREIIDAYTRIYPEIKGKTKFEPDERTLEGARAFARVFPGVVSTSDPINVELPAQPSGISNLGDERAAPASPTATETSATQEREENPRDEIRKIVAEINDRLKTTDISDPELVSRRQMIIERINQLDEGQIEGIARTISYLNDDDLIQVMHEARRWLSQDKYNTLYDNMEKYSWDSGDTIKRKYPPKIES